MKRAFGFLMASGLLLTIGIATYADIAKPKVSSPEQPIALTSKPLATAGLRIEADPKAYDARLQISQNAWNELKVALNDQPGGQSTVSSLTTSSPRTIFAGLSLFAALSLGGIWLVRSGSSRSQKVIAAALIGMAVISAGAMITRGNGAPPAYRWRALPQNLTEGRATSGFVTIEVVAEGDGLKLILPITPKKPKENE